jgi:site-specific recombinase XerD
VPDFYDYGGRLQRKLEVIKNTKEISQHNRNKILEFQKSCLAQGLSTARMLRYLNDLPRIASKLKKDFEKVNRADIEAIMADIEATNLAHATKLSYAVTIKKFYKWLNGGDEYPKSVKWLRTTGKKNNKKLPEDLLNEDEVKKMIEAANNSRDRALISILWEAGCRVGELLSMQVKHVNFENDITRITIQGKTGMRRIPLIDSTPYLAEWIENHPFKNDPNAPLWVSIGTVNHHQPLEYGACRKMLQEVAKKAGIKKAINPHNYRHSRATSLANHFTEAQMNEYFGWIQGSDISQVYVHLSGRDLDDCVLNLRGMKPKEEKIETTLAPKKCPRCGTINKSTGKFCIRCGLTLDLKTALTIKETHDEIDKYLTKILDDEDIKTLIRSKLKGMTKTPS